MQSGGNEIEGGITLTGKEPEWGDKHICPERKREEAAKGDYIRKH